MMKRSFTENIRKKYIKQYLESAQKINYTDLTENDGLIKVFYDDLPKTAIDGYPVASDYVALDGTAYGVDEFNALSEKRKSECKLRYYYLPYTHELYIGTTGSGKTTGCVEPQLRAISSQKNKPNLFLTDPKGELFDRNAKHLKDNGYETIVLNFKDLTHSDKWNPLLELYQTKMKLKQIGTSKKEKRGKIKKSLKLMGKPEQFLFDSYIEYEGMAFFDYASYENYVAFEKDYLEAEIDSLLNQLSNMIIKVQSTVDKSWEYGAQDLLKGVLQCMLEEAVLDGSGFTADMMNFRNLQQYYLSLKTPILNKDSTGITLENHPLLKNKTKKPKTLMATALANAPNTMRSYCGVFDNCIKDWFQGHIFALTSGNTVNLNDINKPFAIFLITRDYEKSDFLIAGLFIDWVYRQMVKKAENVENPRALHFLLDEFGNIPEIKDLENKIATARSRNIWFHLVVQSYMQLDHIYDAKRSVIIRDNCNSQIFLGSQNMDTKQIFSKECGKHNIPTLESTLVSANNQISEVPLIPVSMLDHITAGKMYVKRLAMPVITSQYIRSYVCANNGSFKDFNDAKGLETLTPICVEPFTSKKYSFAKIFSDYNSKLKFD